MMDQQSLYYFKKLQPIWKSIRQIGSVPPSNLNKNMFIYFIYSKTTTQYITARYLATSAAVA